LESVLPLPPSRWSLPASVRALVMVSGCVGVFTAWFLKPLLDLVLREWKLAISLIVIQLTTA
jgi:hypothetical protein